MKRILRSAMWVGALVSAACAVALVSAYDEPTERAVTGLQTSVDSFLISLAHESQAPACTYEKHKNFYTRTLTSVSALEVRNRARPQNELTADQIVLLDSSLVLLERLHKVKGDAACMSPVEIDPLRRSFNSSFTAILTLELAKKRGT